MSVLSVLLTLNRYFPKDKSSLLSKSSYKALAPKFFKFFWSVSKILWIPFRLKSKLYLKTCQISNDGIFLQKQLTTLILDIWHYSECASESEKWTWNKIGPDKMFWKIFCTGLKSWVLIKLELTNLKKVCQS